MAILIRNHLFLCDYMFYILPHITTMARFSLAAPKISRLADDQDCNVERAVAQRHRPLGMSGRTGEQERTAKGAAHPIQARAARRGIAEYRQRAMGGWPHQKIPGERIMFQADMDIAAIHSVRERIVSRSLVAVKNDKKRDARI